MHVQQLQRLDQFGQRAHARDTGPAQERIGDEIRPGHAGGVAECQGGPRLGGTGLDRDDGNAAMRGQRHRLGEGARVVDALDMQADGGDPVVLAEGCDHRR